MTFEPMRALQLESHDGPAGLRYVQLPEPDRPEAAVLLDVHAIGINFPDLLATQGLYQYKPPLPYVPGCEIAGVIRAAPDGSRWRTGQRVAAFVWEGGFAEVAAAPSNSIVPIPGNVSMTAAAAMVVNYHTALFALDRRGRVQAGEDVLVLGAAGGIGTAAVQVAKGLGARVIAGIANEAQRDTAARAGADSVLVLDEGFAKTVRGATDGRGVGAVVDPVGGTVFDEALRALAPEGRVLVVGFAAGAIPALKLNRLLLRNVSVVGVAWGAFLDLDEDLMARGGAQLDAMLEAGHVEPQIGAQFSFDEIPSALEALQHGKIAGKGVATVRAEQTHDKQG